MEEMGIFIENCLKDLDNPGNEMDARLILEGIYSDVLEDGLPPEVKAFMDLKNIGEEDMAKKHLYPMIAELAGYTEEA